MTTPFRCTVIGDEIIIEITKDNIFRRIVFTFCNGKKIHLHHDKYDRYVAYGNYEYKKLSGQTCFYNEHTPISTIMKTVKNLYA